MDTPQGEACSGSTRGEVDSKDEDETQEHD